MTYKETYRKYFGYALDEYYPCEMCTRRAVDIHHIKYKSRGGTDNIENLIGLCRDCHTDVHNEILSEGVLRIAHLRFMTATTEAFGKKL